MLRAVTLHLALLSTSLLSPPFIGLFWYTVVHLVSYYKFFFVCSVFAQKSCGRSLLLGSFDI